MRVLYFAWLRQRTGLAEESVTPPQEVRDVAQLMAWLARRSDGHAAAFADPAQVRAALDQEFATADAPIAGIEEIAFFPPVTGG